MFSCLALHLPHLLFVLSDCASLTVEAAIAVDPSGRRAIPRAAAGRFALWPRRVLPAEVAAAASSARFSRRLDALPIPGTSVEATLAGAGRVTLELDTSLG